MRSQARVAWRAALVAGTIVAFLAEAALREPALAAIGADSARKRKIRSRALGRWARFLLGALGFGVQANADPLSDGEGVLLVANHLSFWDVVAIASRVPVTFVTSVEIRQTPVLGWIARAAGCLFVERRDRSRKEEELEQMTLALRQGSVVVLFPEATSTDGSSVLPFKKSFFASAIRSGCPVVPVSINYGNLDGGPVNRRNRDLVFYYGDQKFHVQLLRALKLRSLEISLRIFEPIRSADREMLAQQAYDTVVSGFVPVGG